MNKNEHLTVTYIPTDLIDTEDQPVPELLSEEYDGLKQSIATIGLGEPVKVVLKSDGRYRVLDGRNRLKATKELGHTEIPCIIKNIKADYRGFFTTYDLELFRRRLSDEDHKRILTERNRLLRKWTQQAFEDCLQRIIPELHKDIKQLFEETKDPDTVVHLSLIPEHLQKDFYKATYSITIKKEAEQKLTEALQRQKEYEFKRNNLVHEVKKLKKVEQEYKELIEQCKVTLSLKKKEIKKKGGKISEQHQIETPQQVIKDYQKELKDILRSNAEVKKLITIKQNELNKVEKKLNLQKSIVEKCRQNIVKVKTEIASKIKKLNQKERRTLYEQKRTFNSNLHTN